jgi:hypothetical protein
MNGSLSVEPRAFYQGLRALATGAFSGKVDTGFPQKNATT